MDSKTAHVLDTYQENLLYEKSRRDSDGDDSDDFDEDKLLDELDNDPVLDGYRERRMQELSEQMTMAKRNAEEGFGKVQHLDSEKEVLEVTTRSQGKGNYAIVHFSHPDFQRCNIMREKLEILAKKHMNTRFLEINATDAPFLVTKLGIKVLPCVIGYTNGKEAVRFVGFEQLGNSDTFSVETLETQLLNSGVIQRAHGKLSTSTRQSAKKLGGIQQSEVSDSDE